MARASELEACKVQNPIRVILLPGTYLKLQESELPFEIHRCEHSPALLDLCDGLWSNVLLIDLAHLATSETSRMRVSIEQLNNTFRIAVGDEKTPNCEQIIRMGFAGLLGRDETPATVVRAVEAVVAGQLWFPRVIVSRVLRALLAQAGKRELKPREMEILELIGRGLSNQEIADTLFISRETVRWHVRGLNSKLGIKDRRIAREYCRSIQQAVKGKPVRPEIGDDSQRSETAS